MNVDKSQVKNIAPLIVLMVCLLAPIFILASEVDGDEFIKAGTGVAFASFAGVIMAGFKLWKVGG